MDARINIEDNIFILNIRIRMIENLLLLDADPALFLAKTLEDADFISLTLDALFMRLAESTRYIDQNEQLHNLSETESAFSRILAAMHNGAGAISASRFPEIAGRLSALMVRSRDRKKEIDRFSVISDDNAASEPLVSADELSELLRDME
ncbi:MAG: hypothetical protein LBC88_02695 [Spirochaetaceae bacterium]|jgi:hypothetical protein|nr:hypothetical protein [Spirochaetaceae bacterium]